MGGNSRVVKKLLIRGADRNIVDSTGKKPIDMAKDNEFYNITDMLEEKVTIASLCNIRPGFKP